MRPFSLDEIRQAVWDCDNFKSPGPDGINFGFIKEFWQELKDDFMRFLTEFHRNGKLTKGVNSMLIVLIPKAVSPQRLVDYRPITLMGCMYKVLAKVLANMLRTVIVVLFLIHSQLYLLENRFLMVFLLLMRRWMKLGACTRNCFCLKWISKRLMTGWTLII